MSRNEKERQADGLRNLQVNDAERQLQRALEAARGVSAARQATQNSTNVFLGNTKDVVQELESIVAFDIDGDPSGLAMQQLNGALWQLGDAARHGQVIGDVLEAQAELVRTANNDRKLDDDEIESEEPPDALPAAAASVEPSVEPIARADAAETADPSEATAAQNPEAPNVAERFIQQLHERQTRERRHKAVHDMVLEGLGSFSEQALGSAAEPAALLPQARPALDAVARNAMTPTGGFKTLAPEATKAATAPQPVGAKPPAVAKPSAKPSGGFMPE
jgi:hypothetical protein